MWSSVLGLALMGALNPVRLGVTLLLISRQRPAQNILIFWAGCLLASAVSILVPLIVLHFTPVLRPLTDDLATPTTSSTSAQIQVGIGVFALVIAAALMARLRIRQKADAPAPGGSRLILVLDPNASRAADAASDESSRVGSAVRRLVTRARNAWENGSLWVAFVIGLAMGPAPEIVLLVLATILTSGAAIATQLTTAIVYIVGVLGVVEVVIISHLVAPEKTEAVLRRLRRWALARRQQILASIFTVIGVSAVLRGLGVF